MNDKSNPNRSRRPSGQRRKASQFDSAQARGEIPVAKTSENWIENLLAGRGDRPVHCFVEDGKMKAVLNRRILIHESGKVIDALFFYPIEVPDDFENAEAWLNEFWPLSRGRT